MYFSHVAQFQGELIRTLGLPSYICLDSQSADFQLCGEIYNNLMSDIQTHFKLSVSSTVLHKKHMIDSLPFARPEVNIRMEAPILCLNT